MAKAYMPQAEVSGQKPVVVRVIVQDDDTFTIPVTATPGALMFNQWGAYMGHVPTRAEIVASN
ncbi:MAG: hypothetical protein KGI69_02175 [Patescibacteria group bacterium]|nr:hypothetical protein [Patescibacteria group bacterium]